jgi:hypothetical protein
MEMNSNGEENIHSYAPLHCGKGTGVPALLQGLVFFQRGKSGGAVS